MGDVLVLDSRGNRRVRTLARSFDVGLISRRFSRCRRCGDAQEGFAPGERCDLARRRSSATRQSAIVLQSVSFDAFTPFRHLTGDYLIVVVVR